MSEFIQLKEIDIYLMNNDVTFRLQRPEATIILLLSRNF